MNKQLKLITIFTIMAMLLLMNQVNAGSPNMWTAPENTFADHSFENIDQSSSQGFGDYWYITTGINRYLAEDPASNINSEEAYDGTYSAWIVNNGQQAFEILNQNININLDDIDLIEFWWFPDAKDLIYDQTYNLEVAFEFENGNRADSEPWLIFSWTGDEYDANWIHLIIDDKDLDDYGSTLIKIELMFGPGKGWLDNFQTRVIEDPCTGLLC